MKSKTSLAYATVLSINLLFAVTHPAVSQDHSVCFRHAPTGNDIFSVGEVRTAILDETDFQELNGAEWILMDGRALQVTTEISPFIRHLKNTRGEVIVPDARGRFLRMANNSEEVDLAGDRQLGTPQEDAFREHDHRYNDIYFSENRRWLERQGVTPIDILDDGWSNNVGTTAGVDKGDDGVGWDRVTERAGEGETRPANIAVNFFIKICRCRTPQCR